VAVSGSSGDDNGIHRNAALSALLVSLGYYLGAKIGFALTSSRIPFRPVAAERRAPRRAALTPIRYWWLMLLAVFQPTGRSLQSGVPIPMMLCWFISNCSSADRCDRRAQVDQRSAAPGQLLRVGAFVAFAGFLAVLVIVPDASFVVLSSWGEASYWQVWRTRLLSNILANLTVVR
jgi:hypothetical protein